MIYPHARPSRLGIALTSMLLCAPASIQAWRSGQLSGSVADQNGTPLPSVHVTIRGVSTLSTDTDATGGFAFSDIPDGQYELSAALTGFAGQTRVVRVHPDERVVVSLTLHAAFMDETVVTATKSGERDVQTIPMAITAISNTTLARLGTQTLYDATALAPSVTLSQNVGFGQLTIRGIGTNLLFGGSDPSSALYLDGVYLARPAMAFVQFLDLDRVEVLRGPQGTLYGRNAVGGAINLVSRAPTNAFETSGTLTAGTFGAVRANARVAGALKPDRVMASLAFERAIRDGYVRDLEHPDHPLGGDDVIAARGQVRFVMDQRTDVLVSADVDSQEAAPLGFNKVIAEKPGFEFDNPADFHDVRSSVLASNRTLQDGASARLTMALTPTTSLVSLTAFRTLDYQWSADADATELNLRAARQHERQHQLSEEITLSHRQPRLAWVGGVFLFDERDHQSIWSDNLQSRIQTRLDPRVDALSRAVFGEATVELTSRLSATGGIRYTHEGKDIDNAGGRYGLDDPAFVVPGSTYDYSDSITHSAWTPKAGLDLRLSSGVLAYVSATRGFKSGGFNPSSTAPGRGYSPEWAWSYEAGVKGARMGGRIRFNAATFVMDYTNLQVQTPLGGGVFDIRNAAGATIKGVELEGTSRIGRGLEAGGHFTWLDAKYDQYIAVASDGTTADVAGNRLNNAPEWAGRLWLEWTRDVGTAKRVSIAADASAQSRVFYTPFNDRIQQQPAYGLLGMRVEYGPTTRRWAVAAYARNLTNTDYITASFGTPPNAFGGRPGPPRQVSVEFTLRR